MPEYLTSLLRRPPVGWWDLLDIAIVSILIYEFLKLIRGTRAVQMAVGSLLIIMLFYLSRLAPLQTLNWMIRNMLVYVVFAAIVIFQSDIRRALTRVGRGVFGSTRTQEAHTIEEIVRACQALAQRRVGALVAIEREVQLDEFVEQGTPLDAELTRDLLISIFLPYSPLHDGAVVVRRDRIANAGCILPIAMRANLNSSLGTRHRAAIGVTEETDALVVVVSEETGKISLVSAGEITEDLDGPHLRQSLLELTGGARESEADEAVKDSRVAEVQ
jgi:diadenylate cyclase